MFPDSFQNQFKVYDFGFYLHQETTSGGYPEAFAQKIQQVSALSPYYLLFGKQTDAGGIYTKFWVSLKLPNKGIFYCLDQLSPALRDDLIAKYGIVANNVYKENENSAFRYYRAEIQAMDSLKQYLIDLRACCIGEKKGPLCTPCVLSGADFGQNLVNKGFSATENQQKLGEIISTGISSDIVGRTNLILEIEGEPVEIDKQMSGIAERYVLNNPGKTIRMYLNRYDNICGNFDAVYQQFLSNGSDAKIFVVAIQNGVNQVKLYFYYDGELGIDEADAIEFVKGLPDHYFDLDGNYLGKDEGNWSRIRVINKPLSQITGLYKNEEKQLIKKAVGEVNSVDLSNHIAYVYGQGRDPGDMFSKIGGFYAAQLGFYKPVVLTEKAGIDAIAWTTGPAWDAIYINKTPFYPLLNNYMQFTNTLYHENLHILTRKGTKGFPCEHAQFIYLEQIKHPSFSKCSDGFRIEILIKFGCYLAKCIDVLPDAGGGQNNVEAIRKESNRIIKKYNYEFTLDYQGNAGGGHYICKLKNTKTGMIHSSNCTDQDDY